MKAIGIDIGTTGICLLVLDGETGKAEAVEAFKNDHWLRGGQPWERMQDADGIVNAVTGRLERLLERQPDVCTIGITGQMHGILYVDGSGRAVSPLYTWQDGRGDQIHKDGRTYTETLCSLSGATGLATGYGVVTHFALAANGLVPGRAKKLCTIGDYLAMRLCGRSEPLLHASNPAGVGLYDLENGEFCGQQLVDAGFPMDMFPAVESGLAVVGRTDGGIPVCVALGDNQAGFLGSVSDDTHTVLINGGTGGQVSVASAFVWPSSPLIELRPLAEKDSYLLVGSSLCAGSAYALLAGLFTEVSRSLGAAVDEDAVYRWMGTLAEDGADSANLLAVSTLFLGTRAEPGLRGSIGGIGLDNLTPRHLVQGFLQGILAEYESLFALMPLAEGRSFHRLVCCGNGIRRNRALQGLLERSFHAPVLFPLNREEACCGAALCALVAAGEFPSLSQARSVIRYERD